MGHNILRRLATSIVLTLCVLLSVSCNTAQKPTEDRQISTKAPNFAAFEASVYREPTTGVYIVDGDIPIKSKADLRDYYDRYVAKDGALIVHRVGGVDSVWDDEAKHNLTYCVSRGFGPFYSEVVATMNEAVSAWMAVADVSYQHIESEDGRCDASNMNVVFDVSPAPRSALYTARAFFPDYPRAIKNVLIHESAFSPSEEHPELTVTGVLRHELGHTLGFRHEHIRPQSNGDCGERAPWRAVTPYDRTSVMHYPHARCGGNDEWSLRLSDSDIYGVVVIYGEAADQFGLVTIVDQGQGVREALEAGQTIQFPETVTLGYVDFCLDQNRTREQHNGVTVYEGDGLSPMPILATAVTTLIDSEVPCGQVVESQENASNFTWFRGSFAQKIPLEGNSTYTISVSGLEIYGEESPVEDPKVRYVLNQENPYSEGVLWDRAGRNSLSPAGHSPFVRGDANQDGVVDISDGSFILNYLFRGGSAPGCADPADANDDGVIDISDASHIYGFQLLGTAQMPAPYPNPGYDPTSNDPASCGDRPLDSQENTPDTGTSLPAFDMLLRVGIADQTPPTVEVTGMDPADPITVGDIRSISVQATDMSGINSIALYLDGVRLAESDTSMIDYQWDTRRVTPGNHTFEVRAWDTQYNKALFTQNVVLLANPAQSGIETLASDSWEIRYLYDNGPSDDMFLTFSDILNQTNQQGGEMVAGGFAYSYGSVDRAQCYRPTVTSWFPEDNNYLLYIRSPHTLSQIIDLRLDITGTQLTGHMIYVRNDCGRNSCLFSGWTPVYGARLGDNLPEPPEYDRRVPEEDIERMYRQYVDLEAVPEPGCPD